MSLFSTRAVGHHVSNTALPSNRSRCTSSSTVAVLSERETAPHHPCESATMVNRGKSLERVAQRAIVCPAPNGRALAATTIPGLLATAQRLESYRPTPDISGVAGTDRSDVDGEPDLGIASNRWGTAKAGHQCRQIYGGEIPTTHNRIPFQCYTASNRPVERATAQRSVPLRYRTPVSVARSRRDLRRSVPTPC